MKVSELITELMRFPLDDTVVIQNTNGSQADPSFIEVDNGIDTLDYWGEAQVVAIIAQIRR